jgi:2-oxoglutarate ferredoxin oxidoreductase subunit beta
MTSLAIDEFVENYCEVRPHELKDYETEVPRWCKGCGDHGVLSVIQRLLRDEQVDPENVVAVSGIGCSSRLPHYLKTYGFHGIHGRALPVSLGVALARPDVHVMTVMGDGDCFSIGASHWVHTLRYNPRILVMVLDNEVYALTKNQVSPTSQAGAITNTTPHGAYLKGMNPLSTILGVTNVSFLAQTASWLPVHMEDTLRKAWHHRGMAFVRILARCPVFLPNAFGAEGSIFPAVFLENPEGVPVNKGVLRTAPTEAHDHRDLHAAQRMALREDGAPMGLLYWNPELPSYEEVRWSHTKKLDRAALISAMNAQLDKYSVQ